MVDTIAYSTGVGKDFVDAYDSETSVNVYVY